MPLGQPHRGSRWPAGVPLVLVFALAQPGCGSSSASNAKSADDANTEGEDSSTSSDGSSNYDGESSSGPSGPDCSDGTCFVCGEGLCPQGFYCDAGAGGGPACSWLPECADTATCGCIEKVLGSGCSCDDSGDGPHVTCD